VASLRDGTRKVLIRGGTFARLVAPGHLTYVNQGTLYAIAFDVTSLTTSGPAIPIIDDVAYSATFGYAQVSASETGTLVYRQATASGRTIVARVERSGVWTPLLERPGRYGWPALSPDGRRLALASVESGVSGLTVFDLGRPARQAWTVAGHDAPLWTGDGTALVARRGNSGLSWLSGATGALHPFLDVPKIVVPWTFARGDRAITMAIMDTATVFDLWSAPVKRYGDSSRAGRPVALLQSRAFETYPAISPDERWLAYSSNASGFVELYVRSLADTGRGLPVARGGRAPRWSPAGGELLYSSADRLMVVTYSVRDGRFVAAAPREWAPIDLADTGVLPNFNVGPDGTSVIALLPERPAAPNQVRLVQGFSELLQRGSTGQRVSDR
jgi:Tol biopolymer transport system component